MDPLREDGRGAYPTLFYYKWLKSSYETVWKIAGGVSARLSGVKKRPNWYSFNPSWPLSDTRFGTYPEFPNSFTRTRVNRATGARSSFISLASRLYALSRLAR